MSIELSQYTLDEVWTPIRTDIATLIKNEYFYITGLGVTDDEAKRIEHLLYNYTHVLRQCRMSFDSDTTLVDLQNLLKETISHKVYELVNEWKALGQILDVNSGKQVSQESFYDVADTPRIERKDFNEFDIKIKQLEAMYNHSQAIKSFYNEIKSLVQTIYF